MTCINGKGDRCEYHHDAAVRLKAPGATEPIPGSGMCLTHALLTVREYRRMLGEVWSIVSLPERYVHVRH